MQLRISRWLSFVGLTFLLAATAIAIVTPPAEQYEISLYAAYPVHFWVLIIGALTTGALAIALSARSEQDHSWLLGLPIIILTNLLILLLPFVRGYPMYGRTDPMSHIGFVIDIFSYGEIGPNIYPPAHLLTIAVADATGLDLMTVAMLLPVVFSLLYFGSLFYLLVTLFTSRKEVLLGLPFAMLPVLRFAHLGMRPFDLSVMLIPLTLYLFFKGQRTPTRSVRVAFVIVLIAQLLYHPLTAVFVIGIFMLSLAGRHAPRIRKRYASPTNVLSLSLALFLSWYFNFVGIIVRFRKLYFTLLGTNSGVTPASRYRSTINEASPPLIDILRVATFKYGIEFLLIGFGLAFVAAAVFLMFRRNMILDTYSLILSGTLFIFGVGGFLFLLMDLIVGPGRAFQIAKICAITLTGPLFYVLWEYIDWTDRWPGTETGFWTIITVALLLTAALSTFSVYKSPLGSERNPQVTEMELEGTQWLLENGNRTENLAVIGIPHQRYHDAEFGVRASNNFTRQPVPAHFNYRNNTYLGASYESDVYLTITRKGRIVYPTVFPDYRSKWRFTPGEFRRLERDRTTNRIYDNGDYTLYFVNGTATE
ncbi:hypothetical protein [Haloarcula litorea]|uniref:hypothetical protein n=1 Tax=Haloarcula litorea TaxID=3032579 RepID=UPI0023E7DEE3|nr:hypothetical protein [Halomicroarcula sp. GDY20]